MMQAQRNLWHVVNDAVRPQEGGTSKDDWGHSIRKILSWAKAERMTAKAALPFYRRIEARNGPFKLWTFVS